MPVRRVAQFIGRHELRLTLICRDLNENGAEPTGAHSVSRGTPLGGRNVRPAESLVSLSGVYPWILILASVSVP